MSRSLLRKLVLAVCCEVVDHLSDPTPVPPPSPPAPPDLDRRVAVLERDFCLALQEVDGLRTELVVMRRAVRLHLRASIEEAESRVTGPTDISTWAATMTVAQARRTLAALVDASPHAADGDSGWSTWTVEDEAGLYPHGGQRPARVTGAAGA